MSLPEVTERKVWNNIYGRRQGRPLRTRKKDLIQNVLPGIHIPLPPEGKNLSLTDIFSPVPQAVWLEIGFGGGEHLAAQAAANPDIAFMGAEFFLNGVASFLGHVEKQGLRNVRVHPGDARPLLDALPDGSIDRCFVLFPDPWPKARHASRRFIGPENLNRLARILKPGAQLRLATDDTTLLPWMLEQTCQHPAFNWTAQALDECRLPPADWYPTRYQEKAIADGRTPHFMTFIRAET